MKSAVDRGLPVGRGLLAVDLINYLLIKLLGSSLSFPIKLSNLFFSSSDFSV